MDSEFRQLILGVFEKVQGLGDIVDDDLAALCRKFHPPVRPLKERGAELRFELFDGLRNGGLGDVELLRRLGETAALRDRIEHSV